MPSPILGPWLALRPPRSLRPGSSSQGSLSLSGTSTHPNTRSGPHVYAGPTSPAWAPGEPQTSLARIPTFSGPQSPSQGRDPSTGLQAPRGASEIFQNSRTLRELQSHRQNPPKPPHRSRSENLNPGRDTRLSAKPRVPQTSQSPQRDPRLLGVSLDPLRGVSHPSRRPKQQAAGSPCRPRELGPLICGCGHLEGMQPIRNRLRSDKQPVRPIVRLGAGANQERNEVARVACRKL